MPVLKREIQFAKDSDKKTRMQEVMMRFLRNMKSFQQDRVSFYGQTLHLQHKMDSTYAHKGKKPLIRTNNPEITHKFKEK